MSPIHSRPLTMTSCNIARRSGISDASPLPLIEKAFVLRMQLVLQRVSEVKGVRQKALTSVQLVLHPSPRLLGTQRVHMTQTRASSCPQTSGTAARTSNSKEWRKFNTLPFQRISQKCRHNTPRGYLNEPSLSVRCDGTWAERWLNFVV